MPTPTPPQTVTPSLARHLPLCIDLDGTLVRTDTLLETLLRLIRHRPFALVSILASFPSKASLKTKAAAAIPLDPASLPFNDHVIDLVRRHRVAGGPTYLVTGAPAALAQTVAEHLGCFDDVIATQPGGPNLTGSAKRRALVDRFGERGYAYAGNSRADLPAWRSAQQVIVVEPSPSVRFALATHRLQADSLIATPTSLNTFLRSLRPFHWTKNFLVFVPLLASHQSRNVALFLTTTVCFVAFNLVTSSVYLVNDLLDLQSDRRHPTKRLRPFAAGTLALPVGIFFAPVLLVTGLLLAYVISAAVSAALLLYAALVLAYSLWIKRIPLADVIVLSGFYTIRILIGGLAANIPISPWLLMLSVFLFLSLAMAKRHSELSLTTHAGAVLPGRGYRQTDAPVVLNLGISCGAIASLILALYVRSDLGVRLYSRPEWLYGMVPLLLFWLGRLWLISGRGELDADPLMFMLRDRTSWFAIAVGIGITLLAGPQ